MNDSTRARCDSRLTRSIALASASAGEAFHHESGATARDVRDDRSPTMDFRDDAQVDRKREMNRRAFLEPEIFGLDKDAVRAQITCATQLAGTTWNGDIDRSTCTMTSVEASLHVQIPKAFE